MKKELIYDQSFYAYNNINSLADWKCLRDENNNVIFVEDNHRKIICLWI